MDFVDINKNLKDGQNMGGIAQTIYYGLHADVATWPTKPNNPETLADLGKLTGTIAMKPGKRFFKYYLTDDTGEVEFETVGEKDGKSYIVHLRAFHPGLQDQILGFMNAVKNENMVFIVPDNNGQFFLMGDLVRPATLEGSDENQGTGKETSARRGMSIHFTFKTANMYEYTGSIPLTPATSE